MKKIIPALIYLIFFLLSLGQLQRLSFYDQQINFYLHEIVLLVLAATLTIVQKSLSIKKMISEHKPIIGFMAILMLSLIAGFFRFTDFENLVGWLYWSRLALYFYFFILLKSWNDKLKTTVMNRGLLIASVLTIIFSYGQYFLYPDLRNLYYLGWDPHLYRAFGLFFDTSLAGFIYLLLLAWLISIPRKKFLIYFLITAMFGLVMLTYSRITYIGLLSFLIVSLWQKANRKMILLGLVLFTVILINLPRTFGEGVKLERIFTIRARIADYQKGLSLWSKSPLLGYGYDRIRFVKGEDKMSHAGATFSSSYLTILVSAGITGLAAFFYLLVYFWSNSPGFMKKVTVVLALVSVFENVFFVSLALLLYLTLLASFNRLSDK